MVNASPKTTKAYDIAKQLHAGQFRKITREPYITHPVAVAEMVRDNGGNQSTIAAAYLHDVLEDVPNSYSKDNMLNDFGHEVTDLVDYVTETKLDNNGLELPWKQRKVAYISRIKKAPKQAQLISLADKVNNIRSMLDGYQTLGSAVWTNFKAPAVEQFWYYSTLNQIFIKSFGASFPLVKQLTQDCRQLAQILDQNLV